jgi:hypothetical protein
MLAGRAAHTPPFGARLRGLFDEAWKRARRRRIALAAAVACAAVAALVLRPSGGDDPRPPSPARAPSPAVDASAPRTITAGDDVPVTFTTQRATGVFGRSGHGYTVSAMAVAGRAACVNNRDVVAADGTPAGTRVTLTLRVRRGEGGNLGWCPGRYRGTITYLEAFRCPATGRCHTPAGFPYREVAVGHFSFRVPARSERSAKFVERLRR